MVLSMRLLKLADFVPEGSVMADIGTDHGHLPISLVESGKCKHAVAMDVRPGPLSHAKEAVARAGLSDQIDLRLSDGLTALKPGEVDACVIAGMGGALITKILTEGKHMWDSVSHFILSPQSEIGDVRRFLADNGFMIVREEMLMDMGKFYVIMDVVRGSMDYEKPYEYSYGKLLIEGKDPVLKDYLLFRQSLALSVKEKLNVKDASEKSKERLSLLEMEMEEISAALTAFGA